MNAPEPGFPLGSNDAAPWHPGKLWSLGDMLRIYGDKYIQLGQQIHDAMIVFAATDAMPEHGFTAEPLTNKQSEKISESLREMLELCQALDLGTATALLSVSSADLPRTGREFALLVMAIYAELKGKLFLFVPPHVAKYYDLILPSIITVAFPLASKEIVAAGNALAAGMPTAGVFHSMRAAEIGVRVLGKELGVAFPDKPIELAEWHNILDQADSKIVAMKMLSRGTHKDDELAFYSQAAVQFRYFKDAWRVRVAHARETYEERPAIRVFDHTLEFFETLATRLKEPPPSV
jgi:hypothetical protein